MNIRSPTSEYVVGDLVGETAIYRIRLCTQIETRRQCLLQIAKDAGKNGILDRIAFILKELSNKAFKLEEEYTPHRKFPEQRLNYHFGFPEVVDTFILHEQGDRRVSILAFPGIDEVQRLVPLHNIVHKDRRRIDLKTSPWIIGKGLKLLAFFHDHEVEIGKLDLTKILIEPNEHFIVFFDFSDACVHSGGVSLSVQRKEITDLARMVITLLGGNPATRMFPDEEVDGGDLYRNHLLQLAAGKYASAFDARVEHYRLIREVNGWKGFHSFTSFPR